MSARAFEAFLTRVYTDVGARARFKANPREEARRAGLTDAECAALEKIDWVGLEMAAKSFANKRQMKRQQRSHFSPARRLYRLIVQCSSFFSLRRKLHPPSAG